MLGEDAEADPEVEADRLEARKYVRRLLLGIAAFLGLVGLGILVGVA